MKLAKILFRLCAFSFLMMMMSCTDKMNDPENGTVSFGLNVNLLKSVQNSDSARYPAAIFFSVKDADQEYVYNMKRLPLIKIGNQYITENLELSVGNYTVEDFIVVDNFDSAIYISPKINSEFADLVNHPLPVEFEIMGNKISEVILEVIPVDLGTPAEYGYVVFSYTIVNGLKNGLIAYYPFDGNARDSSGNNNHGIEFGSVNYVEGAIGLSKEFDGQNDYIELDSTLDGSKGLSFSFWVKSRGTNGTSDNGSVISKYTMSGQRCFYVTTFGYNEDRYQNRLHGSFFKTRNSSDFRDWVSSNIFDLDSIPEKFDPEPFTIVQPMELELNTWEHCVINVTETEIQAWINGILTVKKRREYEEYYNCPNEPTYIGNTSWGGAGSNNYLNGCLDDLRIYNRPLSESEIIQLMNLREE